MLNSELEHIAVRLLARHGYTEAALPEMMEIIRKSYQQNLPPGAYLCKEGEEGDAMWVLVKGTIQVRKRNFQGEEQDLAQVKAPALLGHMALVDNVRRSASCVAVDAVEVGTIGQNEFRALMRTTGPAGDVFRGLLLASLWSQLARGNGVLAQLLNPMEGAEPITEEQTSELLENASASFWGWTR